MLDTHAPESNNGLACQAKPKYSQKKTRAIDVKLWLLGRRLRGVESAGLLAVTRK